MTHVLAALAGGLFALGLVVAGMTDPANVTGFLDVTGDWNPALALVMAAAIGIYAPVVRAIRRRHTPVFGTTFHWPGRTAIDPALLAGSAIFGIGWGLSGYCPGPALVSLSAGTYEVLVFVAAMAGGIALTRLLALRSSPARDG